MIKVGYIVVKFIDLLLKLKVKVDSIFVEEFKEFVVMIIDVIVLLGYVSFEFF